MKYRQKYCALLRRAVPAFLAASLVFASTPLTSFAANVHQPVAAGAVVFSNEKASVDASNANEGYICVKYTGSKPEKVKLIINKDGGSTYTYQLNSSGQYDVIPLTDGNGTYKVSVYENIEGNQYSTAYSTNVTITLNNEFSPFLYPNKYISFSASSNVAKQSDAICASQPTELDKLKAVYEYVVANVSYDYEFAKTVEKGYTPTPDNTLATKKGICFDYAALMSAMLRCQNIPTKLQIGYSGTIYHAWISVYIKDIGWIENVIYFDGTDWQLLDPTFASTSENPSFTADPKNYAAKFAY